MKTTYKLKGTAKAITPIAIVRPNDEFIGGGHSDKTSRLPRAGAKRQDTPVYIPGSSLRGKLRRCAQDRVEAYLKGGKDTPIFSLDEHYMLRQGVDVSNKVVAEKSAGTIDKESALREVNPLLSLFGRWKLAGHSGIGGLIPQNNDCVMVDGKGARSNDFIRTPSRINFLSPDDQEKLQDILKQDALVSIEIEPVKAKITELKKERKATSDKLRNQEILAEIKSLEDDIKAKKDKKTVTEAIQRPLDGYEAIRPGTVLDNSIILQNATENELGLFLETMAEFARNPRIGGHISHMCGEIHMHYEITTFPQFADSPIKVGEITIDEKGFKLTDLTEDKSLESARKSFVDNLKAKSFDFGRFLLGDQ